MSAEAKNGACLVARAVPCSHPGSAEDAANLLEQLTLGDKTDNKRNEKETPSTSPSDFVTLQSIRSSLVAKKTNTSSKFSWGSSDLYSDLLNKEKKERKEDKPEKKAEAKDKEDAKKEVKKEDSQEKDEESTDGELLSRGPVRHERYHNYPHPYQNGAHYGSAALTPVQDYTAFSNYGAGYECGNSNWQDSPENVGYITQSSTPDTYASDQGYFSQSPGMTSPGKPVEIHKVFPQQGNGDQLPDQLADFILKFSRQYTAPMAEEEFTKSRPPSVDSGVDSPMSAVSAPNASPEVPQGGQSGPTTPTFSRMSPRKLGDRAAKTALRAIIPEEQFEDAWAWALKCYQHAPQGLSFQDEDKNTLLHIVTAHLDIGKIYSIVEHLLKTDYPKTQKPFDQPNKNHESPLFLAVMRRSPEVVAYLLEIGANPNNQTLNGDRDFCLHYAAARGMNKITELLCAEPATNLNAVNGRGQTPLLTAIRNHGAIDEATQGVIDNQQVIITLLKAGADAQITDATNGKTIVHYAVERLDPDLIDLLRRNIDEDLLTDLVNRGDLNDEKPMRSLQTAECPNEKKTAMIIPLLTCGAEMK